MNRAGAPSAPSGAPVSFPATPTRPDSEPAPGVYLHVDGLTLGISDGVLTLSFGNEPEMRLNEIE